MRFASFLSGGFTTMAVINPPDWEQAHCIFVQCSGAIFLYAVHFQIVNYIDEKL